jgi:hypothetical protein
MTSYATQEERLTTIQNQGPKDEENKPITEANHLNFAQNSHRPTLEDQRRTHNEIGLKVAHLGYGRTHGVGAPLVVRLLMVVNYQFFTVNLNKRRI